jgi:exonuclease SbcD
MKFVHTADWHLGKMIHGHSLIEDQRHVLMQLFDKMHELKIPLCIVAGDIYDRSIPSVEAVKVLNEVLEKAILEYNIQVIMISGNHDGGERLNFASSLLNENQLTIESVIRPTMSQVELQDDDGTVVFHCLPYFKPATIQYVLQHTEPYSFDEAMAAYLAVHPLDPNKRHVLITHHFLAGTTPSIESDSELPLSVGGTYHVSSEHVAHFDYVALGHLHAPQSISKPSIRYSGSILKYSETEAFHSKGFSVVELLKDEVKIEHIELKPLRDLRIVQGTLKTILSSPPSSDYVMVYCEDETVVMNAMDLVRQVFPNALKFAYTKDVKRIAKQNSSLSDETLTQSEVEVFERFFSDMVSKPLSTNQKELLNTIIEEARGMNNEADPT